MSKPRVLVVDDEQQILRALSTSLKGAGYEVETADTAEAALAAAAMRPPAAVILDLVLPDRSGIEVARELRTWSSAPVIVLSAVGEEREKVEALDAGADDYVTKPFGTAELLARIRVALRRVDTTPHGDEPIVRGDLVIDRERFRVSRDGEEIRLTPTEWGIVETLVRHRDKLVTQRQLLQEVWGPQYGDETNYLRVHLAHIRRKLEPQQGRPRYFITEPGMGYRFQVPEDQEPAG